MDPSNDPHRVLVHRAIPTDPAVRSSGSLFLTEAEGQCGTPSRRLLLAGLFPAPPAIAVRMGVVPGTDLVSRRRLMLVDGIPLRIATSWFLPDAPEAAELSANSFLEGGLQELFDRHGRVFGRAEETLVARLPSRDEAALLQIDTAEPVVEIVRTSVDNKLKPVHTLQTVCAGTRHVFDVGHFPGDRVF
ncbi:MAG: UTRA domain-containing protein [Actinomycetota bacterium]